MFKRALLCFVLLFLSPLPALAENDWLRARLVEHTPSLQDIARPGYNPVSIKPLRAQQLDWNGHDYAALLYSVTLDESGHMGLESYLLAVDANLKIKIEGHKVRGAGLDVPLLRVVDLNKDGAEGLVYVYAFNLADYLIVEAVVFKEEEQGGQLVRLDELTGALREHPAFNQLSGSMDGRAAPLDIDRINAALDAFVQEQ